MSTHLQLPGGAEAPPAAPSGSIHFQPDVGDQRGAEARLIDQPARSFVTWQLRDDAARFFLSYVSAATRSVAHIDLRRLPSGEFVLALKPEEGRFAGLGDLLASRRYIDFGAPEEAAATGVAAAASASTLRQRAGAGGGGGGGGGGAAGAQRDTGGLATLPARIRPPRALQVGADGQPIPESVDAEDLADAEWAKGIRPVASPRTLRRVFGALRLLAAVLAVATAAAAFRFEAHAREDVAFVARGSQRAVDRATRPLFAALRAAGPGARPEQCVDAVRAWRRALSASSPRLQADFESGCGADYLGTLTGVLLASSAAILGLMCVHTGRESEDAAGAEARRIVDSGDADAMAAYARRQRAGRPSAFCNAAQAQWAYSFLPLLAVFLASGALLVNLVWELGAASGALENAARTVSLVHPTQGISHADHMLRRARAAGALGAPGALGARRAADYAPTHDELDEYAWRFGFWGVASSPHVGVPRACLEAAQALVDPLTQNPTWLRAPLSMLLPVVGRLRGVAPPGARARAAALPARAHHHDHGAGGAGEALEAEEAAAEAAAAAAEEAAAEAGGGAGGALTVFDVADPFAGTPLRGLGALDFPAPQAGGAPRRRRALVLPSRSGAIQLGVNLVAVVLFSSVIILMTQETFIKSRLCRALWCQRGDYFSDEAVAAYERSLGGGGPDLRNVDLGAAPRARSE